MTGIERLRSLASVLDEWGLGGALAEIAEQIERERDAEVADSPYDAILPEDREAIAWVREHGGLSHVKDIYHDLRAVVERTVRCRDCRRAFEERGDLWCRGIVGPPVEPDGFCAWGERSES